MPLGYRIFFNILSSTLRKVKFAMSVIKRPHEPAIDNSPDAKMARSNEIREKCSRDFRKCAIIVIYSGTGYFGMQK